MPPRDLCEVPQWLVWRLTDAGAKQPLGPDLRLAPAEQAACLSYEQACALSRAHPGEVTGIGFSPKRVTRDGWALALLDLDKVLDEQGACRVPQTLEQLRQLGAWVERSPSGKGLRSAVWVPVWHPLVTGAYKRISSPAGEPLGEAFTGGFCTITGDEMFAGGVPYVSDPDTLVTVRQAAVVADVEGLDVDWDGAHRPLLPEGLSGMQLQVYQGDRSVDRSHHMLRLLATLSWQCQTVEELAARAWATETLQRYFIDHREHRAVEHQQAFALSECAKAWRLRDDHVPVSRQFELVTQQVRELEYEWDLRWASALTMAPPEWHLENLIPAASTVLIWGAANTGKSWVAYSVAVALASGTDWCDHRNVQKSRKRRLVAVLASEGRSGALDRLQRMMRRYPDAQVLFSTVDSKLTAERMTRLAVELDAYCETAGLELAAVVVDTYVGHSTAKENSADEVEEFLSGIRRIVTAPRGAVLLMVHHAGKDGELRGSSNLAGFFDAAWRTSKPSAIIELECTKMRDFDKDALAGFGVLLEEAQDGSWVLKRAVAAQAAPQAYVADIERHRKVGAERIVHSLVQGAVVLPRADLATRRAGYDEAAAKLQAERGIEVQGAECMDEVVGRLLRVGVLAERDGLLTVAGPWDEALEQRRLEADDG